MFERTNFPCQLLRFGPAVLLLLALCSAAAAAPADADFFERKIRPVLVQHCYQCHSLKAQQAKQLKGGLRLDSRQAAMRGGDEGVVIVPGKPAQSLLLKALRYESLQMPPNRRLPKNVIEDFARWIKRGAHWPAGKSKATDRQKSRRMKDYVYWRKKHWAWRPIADPRIPRLSGDQWSRNAIDKFVLARLRSSKLGPAQQADRITLFRRIHYNLLGLPPTLDQVNRFLQDTRPAAYQRAVDRLLARPAFGEKWGRHWLDVARYADNGGFNSQTKELYTEFHYAYTYRDYVVRAFNEDLPYDRFVVEQLAADKLQLGEDNRALAALGFLTLGDKSFGINLHDRIDDCIDTITRGFMAITVSCARCHDHKYDPIPTADYYSLHNVLRNSEFDLAARRHNIQACNIYPPLFRTTAERQQFDSNLRRARQQSQQARQKIGGRLRQHALDRLNDYLLTAARLASAKQRSGLGRPLIQRWQKTLQNPQARPLFAVWHALAKLGSKANSARIDATLSRLRRAKHRVTRLVSQEIQAGKPESLAEVARGYQQFFARVMKTTTRPTKKYRSVLRIIFAESKSPIHLRPGDFVLLSQGKDRRTLQDGIRRVRNAQFNHPRAVIARDRKKLLLGRVFVRGNPAKQGPIVIRKFLSLLSKEVKPFANGSGRLDLAREIVHPQNPLTARVIVNRVWQQYFGVGLVLSTGDFGTRSDSPSHPRLLDYLATRLIQEDWSLKKLHRRILLSATFRQSIVGTAEALKRDPDNRLLSRMNRRRLSFEEIRDSILASAGNLQRQMRGYPVSTWKSPRRTLYGYINRYKIELGYEMFDFPYPGRTAVQRSQTLIPQQSLFLMNSPFVRRQATRIAQQSGAAKNVEGRIRSIFSQVLARPATTAELQAARSYLASAQARKRARGKPSPWQQLSHALLLSNEYMYVD